MRQTPDNVVDLNHYRSLSQREIVDDISARAFLFLRDAAEEAGIPIKQVLTEHMLGISLVVEAVEGTQAARDLLAAVDQRLGQAGGLNQ